MPDTLPLFANHAGAYEGEAMWYDETGDARRYIVRMSLERTPSGEYVQSFHHTFVEEDNSVIEQKLVFSPAGNGLVTLELPAAAIGGKGYVADDGLHYVLEIPGNAVEVTHFFTGDGAVRTFGSSEKNRQGHRLWWREDLKRVGG